ncbi:MAG TPA: enoyl-CoA hydratase-related protein [Jatrophihabitans sp.]
MTLAQILLGEPPETCVQDRIGLEYVGDRVAVVTLSKIDSRNALSLKAWLRLDSVFSELAAENELRVVVVKGAGPVAFAAGADISEFDELRSNAATAIAYNAAIARALESVQRLPIPVVAMLSGLAVGGGCELAAACDVRIADTNCRMGIPVGRLGVTLGYTEAQILTRLIGPAALKYLLMSGELIQASHALNIGLLQQVVQPAELVPAVVRFVTAIVDNSEVTMRAAKQVADMCGRALTAQDTETLMKLTAEAYEGADLREGVKAFGERRQPVFTMTRGATDGRA